MSQVQAWLLRAPLATTSSPADAPSGHAHDHAGIGPDDDGRLHIPDGDARPFGFRQACAADLKLATRDGRLRGDSRNLRTAVRVLLRCHMKT